MEVKVEIKQYQGDIDVVNLNHWLQNLELYFNFHHIEEDQKILFAILELVGHALTWWEIHTEIIRLEGYP
jgi:hypothetical protein